MFDESIAVYTADTLDNILRRQYVGDWRLDNRRAGKCDYVVVVHLNGENKSRAFFVGKISNIVKSGKTGLSRIKFSQYMLVNYIFHIPLVRNPVHYVQTEDLLPLRGTWLNLDGTQVSKDELEFTKIPVYKPQTKGLDINQAKAFMAKYYNVPASKIDISIPGVQ